MVGVCFFGNHYIRSAVKVKGQGNFEVMGKVEHKGKGGVTSRARTTNTLPNHLLIPRLSQNERKMMTMTHP